MSNEIAHHIEKLANHQHLTQEEAARAFQIVMLGGATPAQIAALLMGLRLNGENVDEITGAAQAMRAKCLKLKTEKQVLDTCGTGGDAKGSLNISTAVAFVVAACGVPVAKHGNRAISSRSGSADVLRELGVNIEVSKEAMERALEEAGICFLMAPKFHTAMRHVAPIRQELGVRTMFNILGPLVNPAEAKFQLIGVYSERLLEPMAEVLKRLGSVHAWVVHGSDGMDELTTTGVTHVAELKDDEISTFQVNPAEFGLEIVTEDALEGGAVQYNATEMNRLLAGNGSDAYRDIVALNAGASLYIAGRVPSLKEGVLNALEVLKTDAPQQVLHKLVSISNE